VNFCATILRDSACIGAGENISPRSRFVAIALARHFPFNRHNFFAAFQTGYYLALK